MRRPYTPREIAPRTFRRRRHHGAGAGPVVARGWGWGWSTEGAEGGGPAPRDAGRRPHRCPDPRDAEPRRRRDSDRGHTRKLAPPSRGSLQTPGCSQRCSRPRDEQRTPPRTAPPAGGCAPGVRLYPMSGGTPGPLCALGSPHFSTRGPVTAPELLSQALRYGEEPSRNRAETGRRAEARAQPDVLGLRAAPPQTESLPGLSSPAARGPKSWGRGAGPRPVLLFFPSLSPARTERGPVHTGEARQAQTAVHTTGQGHAPPLPVAITSGTSASQAEKWP